MRQDHSGEERWWRGAYCMCSACGCPGTHEAVWPTTTASSKVHISPQRVCTAVPQGVVLHMLSPCRPVRYGLAAPKPRCWRAARGWPGLCTPPPCPPPAPPMQASAMRPDGSEAPLLAGRAWLAEYVRGCSGELFEVEAGPGLDGAEWADAVAAAFNQQHVLLIGGVIRV
jgi:hypothetical protein